MQPNKTFWYLINAFLVVLIIFGIAGINTTLRFGNATNPTRTINVQGEGKLSAIPDVAKFSFSVISEGKTTNVVEQDNSKRVNQAMEWLDSQGVEEKDIETSSYNLYPRYTYETVKLGRPSNERNITGYELTQTVSVMVRDLDKAGEIVGGLTRNGANQVSSLNFEIEDPESLRSQARQEAFDMAMNKAQSMAKQAGVNIARVVTFYESGGPEPFYTKGFGGAEMAISMDRDEEIPTLPNFEPGQEEITVIVNVTYEIK